MPKDDWRGKHARAITHHEEIAQGQEARIVRNVTHPDLPAEELSKLRIVLEAIIAAVIATPSTMDPNRLFTRFKPNDPGVAAALRQQYGPHIDVEGHLREAIMALKLGAPHPRNMGEGEVYIVKPEILIGACEALGVTKPAWADKVDMTPKPPHKR